MDIQKMMKQAQEAQQKIAELQHKVEREGAAGGGMVSITINGKGEMKKINIDPKAIDPNEKEMLEDLIIAAYNDAKTKVEGAFAEEMTKILPPGMKLPF